MFFVEGQDKLIFIRLYSFPYLFPNWSRSLLILVPPRLPRSSPPSPSPLPSRLPSSPPFTLLHSSSPSLLPSSTSPLLRYPLVSLPPLLPFSTPRLSRSSPLPLFPFSPLPPPSPLPSFPPPSLLPSSPSPPLTTPPPLSFPLHFSPPILFEASYKCVILSVFIPLLCTEDYEIWRQPEQRPGDVWPHCSAQRRPRQPRQDL